MSRRNLELLHGKTLAEKIIGSNLLIIGVGGIGCELLKNLAKTGFRRFTILDLDIIEETNLNRQFIFRKADVGKYKSEVGRERTLELDPTLDIKSLNIDIRGGDFNVEFFRQFDAVIAALDNMKARAHVAMMCMKAGRHMVDAGTQGFNGQTKTVVRGLSECHNCRPPQVEQSVAVCTIRSKPELPIHCVTYAKNFYDCFFGGDSENSFKGEIKLEEFIGEDISDQAINNACRSVFNALFYTRIAGKEKENEQKNRAQGSVHPLEVDQALKMDEVLINPPSTYSEAAAKRYSESKIQQEKLWSIKTYAQRFLRSMANILKNKKAQLGSLSFQKDDEDCMMIVYCTSTLRTYNFMNRTASYNRHKYQTYYECKDMAGNVIPAIASTNSIAAATEIQQLIKLLAGEHQRLNYVSFYNSSVEKIMGCEQNTPNIHCSYCSKRSISLLLECNFNNTTYGDVNRVLQQYLSNNRHFQIKYAQPPKIGELGTVKIASYEDDKLTFNPQFISDKNTITFDIFPDDLTDLMISVQVSHREDAPEGVHLRLPVNPVLVKRELLEYKRFNHEAKQTNLLYMHRQHLFRK